VTRHRCGNKTGHRRLPNAEKTRAHHQTITHSCTHEARAPRCCRPSTLDPVVHAEQPAKESFYSARFADPRADLAGRSPPPFCLSLFSPPSHIFFAASQKDHIRFQLRTSRCNNHHSRFLSGRLACQPQALPRVSKRPCPQPPKTGLACNSKQTGKKTCTSSPKMSRHTQIMRWISGP